MALKNQDFAKLIENQIAVWQGQIKDHQERLSQAGAEGRANYEKAVAGMRENAEQTGKLLLKVREANEGGLEGDADRHAERIRAAADGLGRRAQGASPRKARPWRDRPSRTGRSRAMNDRPWRTVKAGLRIGPI